MKIDRGSGKPIVAEQGTNTNTRSSLDTDTVSLDTLGRDLHTNMPASALPAVFFALMYIMSCKPRSKKQERKRAIKPRSRTGTLSAHFKIDDKSRAGKGKVGGGS